MMEISRAVLDQIEQEARAALPKESCGLLIGKGSQIFEAVATPNLARSNDAFLIDPEVHLKTQRRARRLGLEIIGCYHSHSDGDSTPSNRDWLEKSGNGFLWMITSLKNTCHPETRIFRQLPASGAGSSRNFVQERLHIPGLVA